MKLLPFICTHCHKQISVPVEDTGPVLELKCPHCKGITKVGSDTTTKRAVRCIHCNYLIPYESENRDLLYNTIKCPNCSEETRVELDSIVKIPYFEPLEKRDQPVKDTDIICTFCKTPIPADTDDNYNAAHSKIQCPECEHWNPVDGVGPSVIEPIIDKIPLGYDSIIQETELYLSRRSIFRGSYPRIMLYKKRPEYRREKKRKYGFWTRRGGSLFEFCAASFVKATGIKLPYGVLIKIVSIEFEIEEDQRK